MLNNLQRTSTALSLAVAGALGVNGVQAQEPYTQPDGSYITISGTVASPSADVFTLDYGDGTILVEMDDWDNFGDAHGLMDGDKVTVFGRIDDDFFEVAKIEAGSVYVENLNAYFYADSDDEESAMYNARYRVAANPVIVSATTLYGTVESVNSAGDEFELDIGGDTVTVDTADLGYDPLDNTGYQRIEKGDYVHVSGAMDWEFIDGRVFDAMTLVTLVDESTS
jgi:hypothetical protein